MKVLKMGINVNWITLIVGGTCLFSVSVNADTQNQTSQGQITFAPGALTLDQVPSFDFGTQNISVQNQTYGATQNSIVRITDLRGTAAGWNLTVKATELQTSSGKKLDGAQITLNNGSAINTSNTPPTVIDGVLTPNSAVQVLSAPAGVGDGATAASWIQGTGVTLDVPGSSSKTAEQYTAELTWTLTDAPA